MIQKIFCCFLTITAICNLLTMSTILKTCSPQLRVAYKYCALSNLHNLDAIRIMVAPEADIYGSKGVDSIMSGMKNFYEKYNDVFWIFKSIKEEEHSSRILIEFDRYWTVKQEGLNASKSSILPSIPSASEVYCSSASEYIDINSEFLVTCIEYKTLPSEPTLFGHSYPECREQLLADDRVIIDSNVLGL